MTRDGEPAEGAAVRVFLVGLMGAGKSAVGRALAGRLRWPYLDNDALLARQNGLEGPALAALGGSVLHDAEARQFRALLAEPAPYVAGVAASIADRPDEAALLPAAGRVFYLRASPETLARRVGRGEGRAWLGDDPLAVLRRMFAKRDEVLQRLGQVVETAGRDPGDLAGEIAARVNPEAGGTG